MMSEQAAESASDPWASPKNGTHPHHDAHLVSILLADWIAPMDGPLIRQGGVAFANGKILGVDSAGALRSRFPQAAVEDLGPAALLPGLVNAHVHLELSALSQPKADGPPRFVDWLKRLIPPSAPDPTALRAFVERGVDLGVRQCLRFGVTTVGDISRHCALTRSRLRFGPLRVVSYGEVQAMAQRRGLLAERLALAADRSLESDALRVGLTPHAPYSVEPHGYRECLRLARAGGLPLATHLAETRAEADFLAKHTGEFRELWDFLGAWDAAVPTFAGGPIRFAAHLGLLDYPTLLAHVNYCDDDELTILAASRASVVYCPRTHAYFGHPPHRWQEMLAMGINVAVGTDSCASSPDLNLVDDLRLMHRAWPAADPSQLWEMATLRAARAIGSREQVGSLTAGKAADFVAFRVEGDDPLREILGCKIPVERIWIGGRDFS